MDVSIDECIERITTRLNNLQQSICDGIDQIFAKYSSKFSEVAEVSSNIERQQDVFELPEQTEKIPVKNDVPMSHHVFANCEPSIFKRYQQINYKGFSMITSFGTVLRIFRISIKLFNLGQNSLSYGKRRGRLKRKKLWFLSALCAHGRCA